MVQLRLDYNKKTASENTGKKVIFIGDGINDAPALAIADSYLSPIAGAVVHNIGSVLVVLSSASIAFSAESLLKVLES